MIFNSRILPRGSHEEQEQQERLRRERNGGVPA
jgi:hypothetical protein